jgi:hypothetical protein|tara:strand:- start:59 stop:433 length:375 start_codon:yes stop_codon:yes gene_type:complete
MENLSIKISARDVAMLRRIANAENRRFDDLMQLVFAEGLTFFFCELDVGVEKLPEDYTEDEQKQRELNEEIEAKNLPTYEAKTDAGFKPVRTYLSNHERVPETNKIHDPLIAPIVQRIKEVALS